jgi:hypothetical protein
VPRSASHDVLVVIRHDHRNRSGASIRDHLDPRVTVVGISGRGSARRLCRAARLAAGRCTRTCGARRDCWPAAASTRRVSTLHSASTAAVPRHGRARMYLAPQLDTIRRAIAAAPC